MILLTFMRFLPNIKSPKRALRIVYRREMSNYNKAFASTKDETILTQFVLRVEYSEYMTKMNVSLLLPFPIFKNGTQKNQTIKLFHNIISFESTRSCSLSIALSDVSEVP
jgi:hypothetical protein